MIVRPEDPVPSAGNAAPEPPPTHGASASLPTVLTPKEVATYLRLPLETVWALLRRGEIPAAYPGRRYRVRFTDIEALFKTKGPADPDVRSALDSLPERVPTLGRPGRPRKVWRRKR